MNNDVLNITNQQAADILKEMLNTSKLLVARGSANSLKALKFALALNKAIKILEGRSDEEVKQNENKI